MPCSESEAKYLAAVPDARNTARFATGYDHYLREGRHNGKQYPECPRGKASPRIGP